MSSKNKNKSKKKQSAQPRDLATEKLTEQLNIDDEQKNTDSILAEYERKAQEAEQRRAERQRLAEQEKEKKAVAVLQTMEEQKPAENKEQKSAESVDEVQKKNAEADVKQFVPHSAEREQERESFTDGVNEAFSEIPEELTEGNGVEDNSSETGDAVVELEHPNKFFLVFAVFVIIMSVIGVISSVNFCAGIISDIANRTDLKNELTLFLYPVVSVDPPDCDSVDELPSTIIIESAIWKIILTGDNTNYEKLYNTYMYVPAIDVEFAVRSIFGSSVNIVHQTVGTMDMMFTYIEDTNSYLVPMNPHYTAYSPRIKELTNVGELYTVTVEYIPPSALAVEGIDFEVSASKTMVYTLSKSKNSTVLHSIKNITRIVNTNEY